MYRFNWRSVAIVALVAIGWAGVLARPASAQERPASVVEFAAGALLFPDDGLVREGFVGGAGRFYVSPRISVGPEVAYVGGNNHSHLILTGNLTFDFVRPVSREPRPLTPFVVVGGGLFRTREEFPGRGDFSSSEGAFTAGGGIRARVEKRVMVGAEARIGWELHVRVNAMLGLRLGPM